MLGITIAVLAIDLTPAQAGFLARSDISLLLAHTEPRSYSDSDLNNVDRRGVRVEQTIANTEARVEAFMQVSPRWRGTADEDGASLTFRASAEVDEFFRSGFGGGYGVATVTGYWQDVLRFSPLSVDFVRINTFKVALDLRGTMSLSPSFNGSTQVELEVHWGLGSDRTDPRLFADQGPDARPEFERVNVLRYVDAGGVDLFHPRGVDLSMRFLVHANASSETHLPPAFSRASFGHSAEFLGLLAYDAEGNLLPDAAQWVAVTSDSGVDYRILSALPQANVPEPSSLVLACGAAAASLVWAHRRGRRRTPAEIGDATRRA